LRTNVTVAEYVYLVTKEIKIFYKGIYKISIFDNTLHKHVIKYTYAMVLTPLLARFDRSRYLKVTEEYTSRTSEFSTDWSRLSDLVQRNTSDSCLP